MRLVLASNNAKKLAELRTLVCGLGLDIVAQAELGIPEAEEPYHSFVENALAKARQAARASRCAAMADDSGLCVAALGGAPGVVSAHFAELTTPDLAGMAREVRRGLQDQTNNELLLRRMQDVSDRRAHFISTLVALRHADDPEPLIACGRWQGKLLHQHRGSAGFGYDPLMFIPALDATVAELSTEIKNAHSHRALAAAQMVALMREVWGLGP